MPFSRAGQDRRKYIQFQWFALNMPPGPTAAPLATDANHTHGVENLYGMTQIAARDHIPFSASSVASLCDLGG